MQVIGVGQHHLGAGLCQLGGGHPFHGAQRAHGHEPRRHHGTVRCVEASTTSARVAASGLNLELEHRPSVQRINLR